MTNRYIVRMLLMSMLSTDKKPNTAGNIVRLLAVFVC